MAKSQLYAPTGELLRRMIGFVAQYEPEVRKPRLPLFVEDVTAFGFPIPRLTPEAEPEDEAKVNN